MLRDVSIHTKGMISCVLLSSHNKHLGSAMCSYGFDQRQITKEQAAW